MNFISLIKFFEYRNRDTVYYICVLLVFLDILLPASYTLIRSTTEYNKKHLFVRFLYAYFIISLIIIESIYLLAFLYT